MIRRGVLLFENRPGAAATRVAGLSLLERGIRTMARAGIGELLIVVPEGADQSLSSVARKLDIRVDFATWGSRIQGPVGTGEEGLLLVLGDCVHHHESLSALRRAGLGGRDLVAQVADQLPAGSASTRSLPGHPEHSGLHLSADGPGPVSSGAFLGAGDLLDPAELIEAAGDMWDFLAARARGSTVALHADDAVLWRRVADRRSRRAAKRMLFSQVTKPTSGPVSRHLNARISIPTSKLLIETGVSPHAVTVLLVLPTGLAAAYLICGANEYLKLALAGVLWQFAAIFDRCDGEIARVKLCESKFGEWFDTVTDNVSYVCAYVGLLIGMQKLYPHTQLYLHLGISAIAAMLLTLAVMYSYALKTGSGSLQNYLVGFARVPDSQKSYLYRFMQRYGFLAKRDFFSFLLCISALANHVEIGYWFVVAGLHLLVVGVLISQHKMVRQYREAASRPPLAAPAPIPGPSARAEERP